VSGSEPNYMSSGSFITSVEMFHVPKPVCDTGDRCNQVLSPSLYIKLDFISIRIHVLEDHHHSKA